MDPSKQQKMKKKESKTLESSSSNLSKNDPLLNYYTVMAPYGDTGTLKLVGISRSATLSSMYRHNAIILRGGGAKLNAGAYPFPWPKAEKTVFFAFFF